MSQLSIFKKSFLSLSVVALTGSLLIGCSGSSSIDSLTTTSSAQNYNGPGSKWDLSLNDDGTFHIDHRPDINSVIDYTLDGTFVRETSGFVNLSITANSGVNAPAIGSQAWGLEVPGYAMMLKPVGSDQLIAMVKSGECPTADFDANWVIVKQDRSNGSADANNANRDFAGQFHFDFASQTPSLPAKKSLANGFPSNTGGGIDPGAVTCQGGIMNIPGAIMYLTSNGGAIVHTDNGTVNDSSDDSFIFGLGQKTITNVNETDGQYAGLLFDGNMSDGSQINPVSLDCTSGTCIGNLLSDTSASATSIGSATITLSGSVNEIGGTVMNGFMTGTIDDGQGAVGNMICMIDQNAIGSGKKIISCVAQSPGNVNEMFNVLFVSK